MKLTSKATVLLFNVVTMLCISCSNEDFEPNINLEGTSWRLTKETWHFPNGETETYLKTGDLYSYLDDGQIKTDGLMATRGGYAFNKASYAQAFIKTNDYLSILYEH